MLKTLASIFSSDKAVNDVFDKDDGLLVKGGAWVNNLHYSEEEKAKMTYEMVKVGNERLRALSPFKVTQRILAFFTMFNGMFITINVAFALWYDSANETILILSDGKVINVGEQIDASTILDKGIEIIRYGPNVGERMMQFAFSDFVFWPITTILGFYFIGGVINSIRGNTSND